MKKLENSIKQEYEDCCITFGRLVPDKFKEERKKCELNFLVMNDNWNYDEQFFSFFKLTPKQFKQLLPLLSTSLENDSNLPFTIQDKLFLTLGYLVSGSVSIEAPNPIPPVDKVDLCSCISKTCEALIGILLPLVIPKPTKSRWLSISRDFFNIFQIPHCLGVIDVKHIKVQDITNVDWIHKNYKGFKSLAMLAVSDAHQKFVMMEVGTPGHLTDKVILENSNLGFQLKDPEARLDLPPSALLPGTDILMPYNFIADVGFPLKDRLLKPYKGLDLTQSQRRFNEKITQAFSSIERTFGLMTAHFGVLKSAISGRLDFIIAVLKVVVCLHNYNLMSEEGLSFKNRLYGKLDTSRDKASVVNESIDAFVE